jgi:copper transport protein
VCTVAVAVAAAAVLPSAAFAHATLLRIEPAAQSVVARAPARITLRFNQEVTPVRDGTTVTGPTGASAVSGAAHLAADDVRVLVIPLKPGLARGDYTIGWRVASTDGHLIAGAFAIGVGAGLPTPQLATSEGSTVDSSLLVARFLYFIGLLVLVGGAIARLTVFAPALRSLSPDERSEVEAYERTGFGVLAFAAAALVVVGGWAAVVRQGTQIAGVSFWTPLTGGTLSPAIGSTRFGREFGHGVNAAAVLFVLILCGYALRRWRPVLYALAAAAVVAGGWALVGPGLSGHAGDPGRGWLTVAVDALHVAGASVWIGGLAHLFTVVAPATASLPAADRRRVRLEIAQRFSRLALASVVVIVTTGVGRALWELSAVSQIWSTAYGRTLLIKTALLGALIVLGYRNRTALGDFTGLRRRVGLELALLVTLIAAVALLTDLAPANVAGSPSTSTSASSSAPRGTATVP